mmetsp:Transcript_28327/g.25027  ORF Transcript_28327/g.25027 Transcript_28327/m.25027 type:complete len:243 (+) Transcript_28327:470-1198(+)
MSKGTKASDQKGLDDTDIVNIGNEISAFLKSDKSYSHWNSRPSKNDPEPVVDEIPNFKMNSHKIIFGNDSECSILDTPKMNISNKESNSFKALLDEIVAISECFQPSEDDIAERILSQKDEAFNINFNIDKGVFQINFDLIPKNNLNKFVSKFDFSCIQLNSDDKVEIKKGDEIKALTTDGKDHIFGFLMYSKTKEPLLIPTKKIEAKVDQYPYSGKRSYTVSNWDKLLTNEEKKVEVNDNT